MRVERRDEAKVADRRPAAEQIGRAFQMGIEKPQDPRIGGLDCGDGLR
jgi:hypothetical protein